MLLRAIPVFLALIAVRADSGETPVPPRPPVERHPSNDDWGTTFVAIMIMSIIAFVALGVLVHRSFQLVPTGVMALRTLVGNHPGNGYHALAGDESEDQVGSGSGRSIADEESGLGVEQSGGGHEGVAFGDEGVGEDMDARVLHIIRDGPGQQS
ncbi:hypothetical protein GGF37_000089 [Kickxella alabastrina]|nr:hypothetical protein GGF37_000089 [Kickxella alabastrina]